MFNFTMWSEEERSDSTEELQELLWKLVVVDIISIAPASVTMGDKNVCIPPRSWTALLRANRPIVWRVQQVKRLERLGALMKVEELSSSELGFIYEGSISVQGTVNNSYRKATGAMVGRVFRHAVAAPGKNLETPVAIGWLSRRLQPPSHDCTRAPVHSLPFAG